MTPLRVGQQSVLEYLEQDIENIGMRFFNLVEQNYRIGLAANLLGQLSALVVADIAGRRTDKLRGRVLLHVFGHIDAYHRVLVAEHHVGERLRELGLADAGRSEEDKRSHRTLRVFESNAPAAYRLSDRRDSLVLTDNPLLQYRSEIQHLRALLVSELLYRYTCPRGHYVSDVVRADRQRFGRLGRLPLIFLGFAVLGQLLLLVAQCGGALEVLRFYSFLLVGADSFNPILGVAQVRRGSLRRDTLLRRGFIDKVNRFIRQIAVVYIPLRQRNRGVDCLVCDFDLVVRFISVAQTDEYLHRFVSGRFADHYRLKTAFERRVLFNVRTVFVDCRRADHLYLTAGERRLQYVRGVDRALGGSRADYSVYFIDKQDYPRILSDFSHDRLHTLLEFAAVFCAGDHRRYIKRDYSPTYQRFGYASLGDALGESLYNRGLSDARLADEAGIVFGSAREYLYYAFGFSLSTNDRIELAVARHSGQVATVLRERGGVLERAGRLVRRLAAKLHRVFRLAAVSVDVAEEVGDIGDDVGSRHAELAEYHDGDAVRLGRDRVQEMLGADIALTEARRLVRGVFDYPLRARRHIARSDACALTAADAAADRVARDLKAHSPSVEQF